jgi:hypothetical protein
MRGAGRAQESMGTEPGATAARSAKVNSGKRLVYAKYDSLPLTV